MHIDPWLLEPQCKYYYKVQREGYLYGGIEPCEFAGPEIAGEGAILER
jgi:hypothetical protein